MYTKVCIRKKSVCGCRTVIDDWTGLLTESCRMSTSIHVYKILCSKYFILYLSEFKPSVSNFLTPFTSFSYLKLNEGKRNKNFKQQWPEWWGKTKQSISAFPRQKCRAGKMRWEFSKWKSIFIYRLGFAFSLRWLNIVYRAMFTGYLAMW